MRKVAREYLEANPATLDRPANKLLVEAFEKAFPKKDRATK